MLIVTSANPAQLGTIYYLNPHLVVAFYKSLTDATKSVVFMSDGQTFDVQETPDVIHQAMKSWFYGL